MNHCSWQHFGYRYAYKPCLRPVASPSITYSMQLQVQDIKHLILSNAQIHMDLDCGAVSICHHYLTSKNLTISMKPTVA